MRFEWDPRKAKRNLEKHGVSLADAATAFGDPQSLTEFDPDHAEEEDRFILLGATHEDTDRGDVVRIIRARMATTRERKSYATG